MLPDGTATWRRTQHSLGLQAVTGDLPWGTDAGTLTPNLGSTGFCQAHHRAHVPSGPPSCLPPPAMGTAPEAWDQLPVPLLCPASLPPPHKVPLDPPQWGPKHPGHMGISGAKEMRKQTGVAEKAAFCCFTR